MYIAAMSDDFNGSGIGGGLEFEEPSAPCLARKSESSCSKIYLHAQDPPEANSGAETKEGRERIFDRPQVGFGLPLAINDIKGTFSSLEGRRLILLTITKLVS